MIDQFILDNVFNHIPAGDYNDEAYWTETKDHDGYIVYWPAGGDHFHTYRHPESWLLTPPPSSGSV